MKKSTDTYSSFLRSLPLSSKVLSEVSSDSMKPTLQKGDHAVIIIQPMASVARGDIVAAKVKNHDIVIHRVVAIIKNKATTMLKTKGDAQKKIDLWSISNDNYIGIVYPVKFYQLLINLYKKTIVQILGNK